MLQDLIQRNRNFIIEKEKYIHHIYDSVVKKMIAQLQLAADYGYNHYKIIVHNGEQVFTSAKELHLSLKGFEKNERFERYIKFNDLREYIQSFFVAEGLIIKLCDKQECLCKTTYKQCLVGCWSISWKEDKEDIELLPTYKNINCNSCFTDIIKIAYDCGHTGCDKCAEKAVKCSTCSKPIEKKLKLLY
jgi:hypothetical protein